MMADERTPEYDRGWAAALQAARYWHEAQARRERFPKNLEREAELHQRCAEQILALDPDDV
jgi:hypothetical protein